MVFIETPVFSRSLAGVATEEEYCALQRELLRDPEAGALIPGGGGIRKIRFAAKGQGKRGGGRAIYYFKVRHDQIFMLLAYEKSRKDDLSASQLAELRTLVKILAQTA
ncbi:type II toxin-antitoxin system RelE/ParE family toxin [Massilia sp. BJB1822]|uniref:type II toxin-antitoxin system RelE/ParE family toxin n=1 Tax=Massilia sp. BJB1822 TaxID=2744470 RepID=UPI001592F084|nr:type II toxin-antitoxin system RelE/ParE family toxin [Massilia sp. BJB1822]NVD99052.1 type II toxin-antitoxin system RelE/ParE family toxin [Massilia sp. BJB1822]